MCEFFPSIILCFTLFALSCKPHTTANQEVRVSGAMRNTMMNGQLTGTIRLDTIQNTEHLYGLGPIENLAGEILIIDGQTFTSHIRNDSIIVEETYHVNSPFFVYATVNKWKGIDLPDTVKTLKQLDKYLDLITPKDSQPFAFKLTGKTEAAKIHVVNLPVGAVVASPKDAHQGEVSLSLTNENVELVGFFSRKHKGIFTHHDTYIHVHLINKDKTKMGHLDDIKLSKEMELLIAEF